MIRNSSPWRLSASSSSRPRARRKPNGVPVDQLAETMRQIRKNEEIARFEFRLENRWLDGGHNRGSTQGFFGALQEDSSRSKPFVFDADEPPCLLGEN